MQLTKHVLIVLSLVVFGTLNEGCKKNSGLDDAKRVRAIVNPRRDKSEDVVTGTIMTDHDAVSGYDEKPVENLLRDIERFRIQTNLNPEERVRFANALESYVRLEPNRAVEILMSMGRPPVFGLDARILVIAAEELGAEGVWKLLEGLSPENDGRAAAVFSECAEAFSTMADPDGGIAKLVKTMDGQGASGRDFLNRYFMGLSAKSTESAWTVLEEMHLSENGRLAAVPAIALAEARLDPAKALLTLRSLPFSKTAVQQSVVYADWMDRDAAAAIAHLKGVASNEVGKMLSAGYLLETICRCDGAAAVDLLSSVPLTTSTTALFSTALQRLADKDFGLTVRLLGSIPDSAVRQTLLMDSFALLARRDAKAALIELGKLDASQSMDATRGVVRQLAASDYTGALNIAGNVPQAQQQDVYREIARVLAYSHPENAIKIIGDPVLSQKLGSDFRQEMLNNTVQTWAREDFNAAQTWVEQLPATDAPKGVQGLMATWMKTDPVAASDWLARMPAGPVRDAGARQVIEQIKDTDPEMAEKWRESLAPQPDGNQ